MQVGLLMASVLGATAISGEVQRSGLYGWGLTLEAPIVGVITGIGTKSTIGWGYNLGMGVAWEVTPRLTLRAYGASGRTYGGQARVRYVDNVATGEHADPASVQDAEWLQLEAGAGAAWYFREMLRQWAPYVGGDLGISFSGFDFRFDDSLSFLEGGEAAKAGDCSEVGCESTHDGRSLGWLATIRAGMRFELSKWMSSQAEMALSYTRSWDQEISDTIPNRDVRTAREHVVLLRMTFTLRLGL
ncbi:MAG: hypothetical protein A2289_10940 [Deltaproteobacteria bacterium RIFOXYA12_FULL_58_15]|nr:MAG: hypothetical protein A2289_10940 [Deltaproteobacteria bacterium RIFOXYA12_FULL_58_15]